MNIITITVNDQPRAVADDATVQTLALALGVAEKKGVAFAVNGGVAPRQKWDAHRLRAGDRVLVISATQGG